MDPDVKNDRFHRQLHLILKTFVAAQAPGALRDIKLQLGNNSAIVDLYIPLQFIIGDVEGGDQLCSRFAYRGRVCNPLCRTCDVSFDDPADTTVYCQWICVADG